VADELTIIEILFETMLGILLTVNIIHILYLLLLSLFYGKTKKTYANKRIEKSLKKVNNSLKF
jgi:hypothetical protein